MACSAAPFVRSSSQRTQPLHLPDQLPMDDAQQALLEAEAKTQEGGIALPHDGQLEDAGIRAHEQADGISFSAILGSWWQQGRMAWPILLQLVSTYSVGILSLAFVGHLGKQELAAAALGTTLVSILARNVLMGLNGALDTYASQAAGAGDMSVFPTLFYRAVLFLWLHCIPLTAILLFVPRLLVQQGTDSGLSDKAYDYLLFLIPNIWIEAVNRATNSLLVSRRITTPQMTVAVAVLPLHVAGNWFLIHKMELGYTGAALATCCTSLCYMLLMFLFLAATGSLSLVWGPFTAKVFLGWKAHASLAYPACFMRCAESLGFSLVTLSSGMLPDPDTAVAAASIAFNLYGILYMGFIAYSMSTTSFLGNALGAGDVVRSKTTALASLLIAPCVWLVVALVLLEPHSQHLLALIFTDGTDVELMFHLRRLLRIVALLELFDGSQTIMSGIITGCGRQRLGALVNLCAYYVLAIPAALLLGFYFEAGVEGMYWGMLLGPMAQTAWYGSVVLRTDWAKEAARAKARLASVLGHH